MRGARLRSPAGWRLAVLVLLVVLLHGLALDGLRQALAPAEPAAPAITRIEATYTRMVAQSAAPTGTRARFEFKDLPPGDYAVMVMHDENGNGKLDSNMIGMPVEGYGFSNNPNVMRKPTFEEARFTLPQAGATIGISLR